MATHEDSAAGILLLFLGLFILLFVLLFINHTFHHLLPMPSWTSCNTSFSNTGDASGVESPIAICTTSCGGFTRGEIIIPGLKGYPASTV